VEAEFRDDRADVCPSSETWATIIVSLVSAVHGRYRAYHRVRSLSAIYANRG